ncbi:hypothetical protein F4776DRAFT_522549 [Hypoxylon sp. NC0597]|nr:hypothetical protein F4776DRAFT_522549 [Hypoxylon sp. NC0597]
MAASKPSEAQVPKHTLNPLLKRPIEAVDDYQLRVGPGWTLNDGTFQHVPQSLRRRRDTPHPTYMGDSFRAMTGLSNLQLGHNAPIHPCAMDVATAHIWRCLPPVVKSQVKVVPPNGPDLWGDNVENFEAMQIKMKDPKYMDKNTESYSTYVELKKKPWIIWPLWVEDRWGKDWVLLVWYADESKPNSKVYDRVRRFAIYDPRRNPHVSLDSKHHELTDRAQRIARRLSTFLKEGGYQMITETLIWQGVARMSPMPLDETTSGERCFAACKEILDWIVKIHVSGRRYDPALTEFPELSRWVNPYQYRVEMTGINAWLLMATFDFNARIAVECTIPEVKTEVVADGKRRIIQPYDLAGPYDPPALAEADYSLPFKRRKT